MKECGAVGNSEEEHLALVIQQQHHQYQHYPVPAYLTMPSLPTLPTPEQLLRQHEERHRQMHQCYMYELQDRLARLQFDPLPQPLNFMPFYLQHSDSNYNSDYSLPPPPIAFRYDTPSDYSRSISSYDSMNSSNNFNNNNDQNEGSSLMSSVFDENDYDDVVEEDSPKKGLLKQMFCIPMK